MKMERRWSVSSRPLLCALILLLTPTKSQVPGLVHTDNGYDNWDGAQAICWNAPREEDVSTRIGAAQDEHSSHNHQVWSNPLDPEFPAGPTTMNRNCPTGAELFLEIDLQEGNRHDDLLLGSSDKLRTHRWYSYQVHAKLDLESLRQTYGLSEDAFFHSTHTRAGTTGWTHPQIGLQLIFCPVNGNLCTPYILSSAKAHGKVRKINAHIHQPSLSYEENIEQAIQETQEGHEGHDHEGHEEDEIYDYWQQWELSHPDDHNGHDGKEDQGGNHDHEESSASQEEDAHDAHAGHNHHLRTRRILLETTQTADNSTTNFDYAGPAPTILELFHRVEEALQSTMVSDVKVSYHHTMGFPSQVAITYQNKQPSTSNSPRTFTFQFNDETVYLAIVSHFEPLHMHEEEDSHNATTTIHAPNATAISLSKQEAFDQAKELWMAQAFSSYRYHYNVYFDGDPMQDKSAASSTSKFSREATPYPWVVEIEDNLVRRIQDANNVTIFNGTDPDRHEEHPDQEDGHSDEKDDNLHPAHLEDNDTHEDEDESEHQHEDHVDEAELHGEDQDHGEAELHEEDLHNHEEATHADETEHHNEEHHEHEEETHVDESEHNEEHHDHDGPEEIQKDESGGDGHDHGALDDHGNSGEHNDHDHGDEHDHGIDEAYHLGVADTSGLYAAASQVFFIEITPTNETNFFEITYHIDVEVLDAGDYLPMASLMFFMANDTLRDDGQAPASDALLKFDMANLLHSRQVTYYEPIDIKTVSNAAAILSYVLIATCACIQLFFLVSTFRHRNESVMKLSQGHFLLMLLVAGFIAQICSIFFQPKSDAFCYLSGPTTHIPLQFMFAIILGRLRRIFSIMAPLLDWQSPKNQRSLKDALRTWKTTMMHGKTSVSRSSQNRSGISEDTNESEQNKPNWFRSQFQRRTGTSFRAVTAKAKQLRQQFTEAQLWLFIFVVTLPVVLVELAGLIVAPPELTLVLDDNESVGKYQCGYSSARIFQWVSMGIILLTLGACLWQVQGSSQLPALFNEASAVSSALVATLFVAMLGGAIKIISGDPSANPDTGYMIDVLIVLFITLNLSLRLALPKMKLIWKGEKVVVSRIIQEHRQTVREKEEPKLPKISGLEFNSSMTSWGNNSAARSASATGWDGDSSARRPESIGVSESGTRARLRLQSVHEDEEISPLENSFRVDEIITAGADEKAGKEREICRKRPKKVVVVDGQDPPSKLTMNVISHSNVIAKIKGRILCGLQVDREEWDDLKSSIDEIQALMGDVEFQAPTAAK